MRFFPRPLAGLVFALCLALPARAEETAEAAMARLAPLEGAFVSAGVRHGPEGAADLAPSPVEGTFILKGNILEIRSQSDMGEPTPVTLRTLISYDPHRGVYRIAAMDDTFPGLDVYDGRFTDETTLVATNLRSDTYFPLEDGRRLHFQLRWEIVPGAVGFDVLATADGGATWSPYFEETWTPRAE